MGELGLRYRPERTEDQADARAALQLLMEDLSDVPADILATAVREVSRTHPKHFGLPGAEQIIKACRDVLDGNERRDGNAPSAVTREEKLVTLSRQYNRENALKGVPNRWTDKMEQFSVAEPGEKRRTDVDGVVFWP